MSPDQAPLAEHSCQHHCSWSPSNGKSLRSNSAKDHLVYRASLSGSMLLVDLPSNRGIRVLVEVGIIMGAAGAVYAVHHLAYGMIMQGGPPGRAETLSLDGHGGVRRSPILAFRFEPDGLRKAKGSWSGRLLKIAVAITALVCRGWTDLDCHYIFMSCIAGSVSVC